MNPFNASSLTQAELVAEAYYKTSGLLKQSAFCTSANLDDELNTVVSKSSFLLAESNKWTGFMLSVMDLYAPFQYRQWPNRKNAYELNCYEIADT
jgi:hypothetical protein